MRSSTTEKAVPARVRSRAGGDRRIGRRRGFALAGVALLLSVVLSLAVGAAPLSPAQVWNAMVGLGDAETTIVLWEIRVPRTLAAIVVGLALAVAGGVIQALVRNPLADPGILGVNAGAAFLVAIAVALLGVRSVEQYIVFAFAGAMIATALVYMLSASTALNPSSAQLVLAGVAVGAVLGGFTSALSILNPDAFEQMLSWSAGSLSSRSLAVTAPVIPYVAGGFVLALAVARSFNTLALGESLAASLGARVRSTRILGILAITLLAGGATAIAGPIGFVGLMMPHVARWIVGPDHRWIFAYSAVLGPTLVLVADVIGRVVTPGELPVGVVTAFIGAPVLVVLLYRRKQAQ
ncbi:iron ABC transporter permease [Leucobacter sp. wl10]|uniref:FecCD family ABC transporter permease n=1 Tax=Leucobacter sp. wl10 TaxID=2304677 RepID=UPI000E5B07CE|nr:iron chelate uptake ABC transporter family permease subunit [Leucobacter sp. wl10]RGE19858.1 iron ABC transporter permease [Leucobacter sp. wl10]